MNYQFSVKATEAHDGELAEFEANSLDEAIKMFIDSFPEDIGNIECITREIETGGVYEAHNEDEARELINKVTEDNKKRLKLAMELMSFRQLVVFHSWFFGYDRDYMIDHMLSNLQTGEDALKDYGTQAEKDWLKKNN